MKTQEGTRVEPRIPIGTNTLRTTRRPLAPGNRQAEVAKRSDLYAAALFLGMTVDAINDFDLSYTPPFGSPCDAVQLSAQARDQGRDGSPR